MEQREDIDLIEAAAPDPAPAPAPEPTAPDPAPKGDALDEFLAEYEQAFPKQEPSTPEPQQQQADPLESREFNQAAEAIDRGIVANMRAAYEAEADRQRLVQHFEQHCQRGQAKCPDFVPGDYYRSELLAQSVTDPRLEIALKVQHHQINPVAVRVELEKVNAALVRAAHDPRANPAVIPSLQQYKWQLEVAYHARTILGQADAAIIKKANARAPIDEIVSADVFAVVQAMKGSSTPPGPEPAPRLGQMSENQFREFTRNNYGF